MVGDGDDSQWKEVELINGYALLSAYVTSAIRGIGYLVVTWTTVVLLGGFVSMIVKVDFWSLALITLIEILWINDSLGKKVSKVSHLLSSLKVVNNQLKRNWQLTDTTIFTGKIWYSCQNEEKEKWYVRVFAVVYVMVAWVSALVHTLVTYMCIVPVICLMGFGLFATTSISVLGLVRHDYYGDTDEGRVNMDPAHNVLYVLCVAQGALFLYSIILGCSEKMIVEKVSEAYGFQDNGQTIIQGYLRKCTNNPSPTSGNNLITYAVELLESQSRGSCLSGILILDKLISRQRQLGMGAMQKEEDTGAPSRKKKKKKKKKTKHQQSEKDIVLQQCCVIKHQIVSAPSTYLLEKVFQMLDSRQPYARNIREAAGRIVEHVAGNIGLEQFPQGIQSVSSLIITFQEYCQLQPYQSVPSSSSNTKHGQDKEQAISINKCSWESESEPDSGSVVISLPYDKKKRKANMFHGYKQLVLTGLRILWILAGSEDNCTIISNNKHLVSKIMAPISYDLVHRTNHSIWSTSVVKISLRVILRLVTTEGETGAKLRRQVWSDDRAVTAFECIVKCEECKEAGRELRTKVVQILTQLCMDETANRCNFTKMLVSIFINGYCSIRKAAGEALVALFLGRKSVATLLSKKENDEFVGDLAKILVQAGDDKACRQCAAEILEHLCVQYAENGEYLSTLKNALTDLMPEVLREICHGSTGEEEKPEYASSDTDVESQSKTKSYKRNEKNTSSSPGQNQQHKLHVALLSLCVTACDKLHLDIDAISKGEGRDQATDHGESITFSLAMKMVRLKSDIITPDSLTEIKLTTRMVIAAMKKLRGNGAGVDRANLESLMESLSSVSETMLDLEGCMVFAAGMTKTKPATVDTLNSLVKQARQLHNKIKDHDSEIVPAS